MNRKAMAMHAGVPLAAFDTPAGLGQPAAGHLPHALLLMLRWRAGLEVSRDISDKRSALGVTTLLGCSHRSIFNVEVDDPGVKLSRQRHLLL